MGIDDSVGAISAEVIRIVELYCNWSQKQGMPYWVAQVLYILRLSNGAVTQKQICEMCKMPKQTINNLIRQLKTEGFITLVSSVEDKREKKIQLTQLGENYVQESLKPFQEINEKVVDSVGLDLLHQLTKGLNTLGNALEREMELKEVVTKWEDKTGGLK